MDSTPVRQVPPGTGESPGIFSVRSTFSVAETVQRLRGAIESAGAKLFALVDHSGEAHAAGLELRDTKLLIFGSPAAGTPLMVASPLAAIDLPLKILVWQDDEGGAWMTYFSAQWLSGRHRLWGELAGPLSVPEKLCGALAAPTAETGS